MKILNIAFIFVYLTAFVLAKQDAITAYDYEVTFYGCPHECHTQTLPSCQEDLDPTGYFCALVSIIWITSEIYIIFILYFWKIDF